MALIFLNLSSLCFLYLPSSTKNKILLAFEEKTKVLLWY